MDSPKIINLILYSPGDEYDLMMDALTEYLDRKGIEHYFYSYKEDLAEEFVIEGNQIFIRGRETVIPGIMAKTISALKALESKNYDYIVRTNVSTIVDFDELAKHMPRVDYSGLMNERMVLDVHHGLTAEKLALYHDHHWAFGVCVILSKKAAGMMIKDNDYILSFGVVDDQVMGIYFHQKIANITRGTIPWSTWAHCAQRHIPGVVVYRNKSDSRVIDACRMRAIIKELA